MNVSKMSQESGTVGGGIKPRIVLNQKTWNAV